MQRRQFLHGILAGAIVACPACRALASEAGHARWSYQGATGPDRWGDLDSAYGTCGTGAQQSPIDLAGSLRAELAALDFAYGTLATRVEDNGHTIEAAASPGHVLTLDGADYALIQFHFHAPSEHHVDGRAFPMEAHFVHRDGDGALAVVGVMLTEGADNADYEPLFAGMSSGDGEAEVALPALLPADRGYYRYAGSLTTPGCAEVVTWLVLREPVPLGPAQIARFTALYPNNARPLQSHNRRFVLRSF